jgi:hypothetical protein
MKKILSSLSLMIASMGAHAAMVEVDDAGLADVRGQINLVSLVNVGVFSDSVFSLVSGFGADSLASGVQVAGGHSLFTGLNVLGATGATGVNIGGVSGVSLASVLGGTAATGLNLGGAAGLSLASVLGITGGTGLGLGPALVSIVAPVNLVGLNGLALVNGGLGGVSVFSGVSLPIGATGASIVTTPWTLNGFGAFNLF